MSSDDSGGSGIAAGDDDGDGEDGEGETEAAAEAADAKADAYAAVRTSHEDTIRGSTVAAKSPSSGNAP